MWLPGGVGESDRQRGTERAEVAGEVGLVPDASPNSSAGKLCTSITTATQASAGRSQPPRPRRAGRARAVTDATRLGTGSAGRIRTMRSMRAMSVAKRSHAGQLPTWASAAAISSLDASPSARADSTSRMVSQSIGSMDVLVVGSTRMVPDAGRKMDIGHCVVDADALRD